MEALLPVNSRSLQDTKAEQSFREQTARLELAQARLRFTAETWTREIEAVQAASKQVEETERQAQNLVEKTGRLSMDLESIRRALQSLGRSLSAGLETLGPVEKRFRADLGAIDGLLSEAAKRTQKLKTELPK